MTTAEKVKKNRHFILSYPYLLENRITPITSDIKIINDEIFTKLKCNTYLPLKASTMVPTSITTSCSAEAFLSPTDPPVVSGAHGWTQVY